jgi:LPS-assembly protein
VPKSHEKTLSNTYIFLLSVLGALILVANANAQSSIATQEPPPAVPPATIAQFHWQVRFETQDVVGNEYTWTGHPVEFEDSRMLFRANYLRYNRDTGDLVARGHVYFRSFERSEQLWCDHLEYNTEDEKGKFWDVAGETQPKFVVRPGILSVNAPFHFEGVWAERIGEKYILHNGWVTNCTLPKPWWRMRGPKFDIIPGDRAITYRGIFLLRGIPLFYAPFFYHSLQKEPRKSGFLMPTIGHSSLGGFMVGAGYFWAINRSYDVTYRVLDYLSRGYSHYADFRGKPREGTDYDLIMNGVQDRGAPNSGNPPQKYSGLSLYGVAHSDLGDGWTANAQINYITSFRYRQNWSLTYNEVIGSELDSTGFVNKNWSTFTLDGIVDRLENYLDQEKPETNPVTGAVTYQTDAVLIHKLPEAQLSSRDHAIWHGIPLWYSFESSAGLLSRSEPFFDGNTLVDTFQTATFTNREHVAPHLTSAFHFGAIHLVPSIGADETFYSEAQTPPFQANYRPTGTDITRSARDFSLDIILPSLARVYNRKTIFGDKLKHVIEPRATYRYVTGIGSDFNRFVRFDETDLLANTNQLELSLTNRIYAKRGNSVQEIFTWELAQDRYFNPTFGGAVIPGQYNVFTATADLTAYAFVTGPRTYSPIVSNMRVSPIGGLGVIWQADYDPYRHGIVDSSFSLDYRWQHYWVSAGDIMVHSDPILLPAANQYRFGLGFGDPNKRGWNAGVNGIYDVRKAELAYTTTQVTYNTNCCGLSVQYQLLPRYINNSVVYEPVFRVAFSVANIGSFGNLRRQDRVF